MGAFSSQVTPSGPSGGVEFVDHAGELHAGGVEQRAAGVGHLDGKLALEQRLHAVELFFRQGERQVALQVRELRQHRLGSPAASTASGICVTPPPITPSTVSCMPPLERAKEFEDRVLPGLPAG